MEEKLLLSIPCTGNTFSSIGYIALYKISEVIYSVRYEDEERCISVDIDSVTMDPKKKLVIFDEPLQSEYSFFVHDDRQLDTFSRLQKECQEVCNRYLEIATRLRDVYYSGVYSSLNPDSSSQITEQQLNNAPPQVLINHELESLQAQTAFEIVEILKNRKIAMEYQQLAGNQNGTSHGNGNTVTDATAKSGKVSTPRSAAGSAWSVKSDASNKGSFNKCFYCNNEYQELCNTSELYVHPYVPKVFDGSPILMCITCLQNWKEYRDTAQYENELILPDEVNEEICCLCSDSPETLTLCGSCPRSYCSGCLLKLLSKKDYQRRIENSGVNWKCMACVNHIATEPPLSRDAWCIWTGNQNNTPVLKSPPRLIRVTSGTSINSGVSTPRSTHSRGKVVNLEDDGNDEEFNEEVASHASSTARQRQDRKRKLSDASAGADRFEKGVIVIEEDNNNGDDNAKSEIAPHQAELNAPFVDISDEKPDPQPMDLVEPTVKAEEVTSPPIKEETATTRSVTTRKSSGAAAQPPNKSLLKEFIQKKVEEKKLLSEGDGSVSSPVKRSRASSGGSGSKGGRRNNKNKATPPTAASTATTAGTTTSTALPTEQLSAEAMYYFQQYLDYEDKLYEDIQAVIDRRSKQKIVTDDSCFLCKDGGNVVECDFQPSRSQALALPFRRCLKVYHQECLGFTIPDDVAKWCCPRHYCSCCGDLKIKYICIFCPNSICEKCPETFVERYGFARYREVTNEIPDPAMKHTTVPATPIVCEGCLVNIEQIEQSNAEFKLKTMEFGPEKRFAGTYNPSSAPASSSSQRKRRKH